MVIQGMETAATVNADVTSELFKTFEQLPFSGLLSVISILLILTFLVTSADSETYILSSMSSTAIYWESMGECSCRQLRLCFYILVD